MDKTQPYYKKCYYVHTIITTNTCFSHKKIMIWSEYILTLCLWDNVAEINMIRTLPYNCYRLLRTSYYLEAKFKQDMLLHTRIDKSKFKPRINHPLKHCMWRIILIFHISVFSRHFNKEKNEHTIILNYNLLISFFMTYL